MGRYEESGRENWNTRSMIEVAVSLQRVVEVVADSRELDEASGYAKAVGLPVLLALGTEIGLKALQALERKGPPDRGHHLDKLFEGLSREMQSRLEEALPEVYLLLKRALGPASIKDILRAYRDTFTRWRYIYETMSGSFDANALNEALITIVFVCQQVEWEHERRPDDW